MLTWTQCDQSITSKIKNVDNICGHEETYIPHFGQVSAPIRRRVWSHLDNDRAVSGHTFDKDGAVSGHTSSESMLSAVYTKIAKSPFFSLFSSSSLFFSRPKSPLKEDGSLRRCKAAKMRDLFCPPPILWQSLDASQPRARLSVPEFTLCWGAEKQALAGFNKDPDKKATRRRRGEGRKAMLGI